MRLLHVAVAWALCAAPVQTDPAEPAAARAARHFEAQEWDEAIQALIEAYAEDPDPAYIYARAQAERMRGNCRAAIPLYRRFLEHDPTPRQRADTERHVRLCEELLFQAKITKHSEQAKVEPAPALVDPAKDETLSPPDRVGPGLLGAGLVAATAGMTLAIVGGNGRRGATDAPTEETYENEAHRGTILLATGLSLAGVGAALVGGAIARFVVVRKRQANEVASGPLVPTQGRGRTAGWYVRGRF